MVGPALPRHDDFSPLRRGYSLVAIVGAVTLLLVQGGRVAVSLTGFSWWLLVAAIGGALAADFVSGLVHWFADTWGRETMPLVGRRLLRPFRVHHVNPADFLRRDFLDTNGDMALVVALTLLAVFACPLETRLGQMSSVFLLGLCATVLPTNQVHQWSHMATPPRLVQWLQDCGLILSRQAHAQHHQAPYTMNYCIATGWCNRLLTQIRFFVRLERLITALTGIEPRADEGAFQSSLLALNAPVVPVSNAVTEGAEFRSESTPKGMTHAR